MGSKVCYFIVMTGSHKLSKNDYYSNPNQLNYPLYATNPTKDTSHSTS